jgi:hypothetical protein
MADIFDFIFTRATLDQIDSRFPMLGQWVLLNVGTYVLETQDTTSHKVSNLGLQRVAIFHVMSRGTGMINTM